MFTPENSVLPEAGNIPYHTPVVESIRESAFYVNESALMENVPYVAASANVLLPADADFGDIAVLLEHRVPEAEKEGLWNKLYGVQSEERRCAVMLRYKAYPKLDYTHSDHADPAELPTASAKNLDTAQKVHKHLATWESMTLATLDERLIKDTESVYAASLSTLGVAQSIPHIPKAPWSRRKVTDLDKVNAMLPQERIYARATNYARGAEALGQDMSRLRIAAEMNAVTTVTIQAGSVLLDVPPIRSRKSIRDDIDSMASPTEVDTATAHIDILDSRLILLAGLLRRYEGMVPHDQQTAYGSAMEHMDWALTIRGGKGPVVRTVEGIPEGVVVTTPSNMEKIQTFYEQEWTKTKQAVSPESPKVFVDSKLDVEAHTAERKRVAAERLAAEAVLKEERDVHDAPIRETLQNLIQSHAELVHIFQPSNKSLRAQRILGGNSLGYELGKVSSIPITDSLLKTYSGLLALAGRHQNGLIGELAKLIDADDRLFKSLEATKHQLYGNGISQYRLDRSFRDHIGWLSENWDNVTGAIAKSAHQPNPADLAALQNLMRSFMPQPEVSGDNDEQETPLTDTKEDIYEPDPEELSAEMSEPQEEPESSPAAEEPATQQAENALAVLEEANRQAERLDWIPIPPSISGSTGTFVRAVRDDMEHRSVEGVLEEARVEDLLMFKELYDGKLYRASERVLGDSKRLYFVLTFTYKDREYAIAENPVYGNATYVIREDLVPLSEGETVLSAAKLDRKYLRDFGFKQHIHDPRSGVSHADKIQTYIDALANEGQVQLRYQSSI